MTKSKLPTEKIDDYIAAMAELSARTPRRSQERDFWEIRQRALTERLVGHRLVWLQWVEERARLGSPEWCVELVAEAVTAKIVGNE